MAIIHVVGNVGNAEYTITPSGTKLLRVSIADNRWNYKDKKEETVWIRVTWFGERAEKLADSVSKAKTLAVTGREAYKIYNDKIDRTIEPIEHKIVAFKTNDAQQGGINPYPQQAPSHSRPQPQVQDYSYPEPPPISEDDLPF